MTRPAARISDKTSAERFCDDLAKLVETMIALLDEETSHMRAARYEEALALGQRKSALAGGYVQALDVLQADGEVVGQMAPAGAERLRSLHARFEAALESNMTVLATARTVSETLLRSLTEEATRSQRTTTYGTDGRVYSGPPATTAIGVNIAT